MECTRACTYGLGLNCTSIPNVYSLALPTLPALADTPHRAGLHQRLSNGFLSLSLSRPPPSPSLPSYLIALGCAKMLSVGLALGFGFVGGQLFPLVFCLAPPVYMMLLMPAAIEMSRFIKNETQPGVALSADPDTITEVLDGNDLFGSTDSVSDLMDEVTSERTQRARQRQIDRQRQQRSRSRDLSL